MEEKKFLEDYYKKLKEALESSKESFIFNKDRSHNATIMRCMFDNSHEVFMYCGSMSVFRDGFYKKIETEEKNGNAEMQKMIAKEAKEGLENSLNSFFQRQDTSLTIILENYDASYLEDLLDINLFKENAAKGKLHILELGDNFTFKKKLSHFSSCDLKMVRLEQDKEEHSAVCVINDDKLFDSSKIMFNKLKMAATPIALS